MKIITFETARVTWLFPLEEFAPTAGTNSPGILAQIAQRYGFTIVPSITTRENLNKNGLVFGMGHFRFGEQNFVVNDFAIYTDGLAAVAEKSEWAEAFLEDVTAWVKNDFGFRDVSSGVRKLYSNTVVVDFEVSPSRLLHKFEQIVSFIGERAITISPEYKKFDFVRLDFEVDRQVAPRAPVPRFVLERRQGVRFEQDRYFSSAPMKTSDHIATLEEIERLAAD